MMSKIFKKEAQITHYDEAAGIPSRAIAYGPGVMIWEAEFKAGMELPIHDHFHEQITYVKTGKAKVILHDGTECVLEEGDAVYFGPWEKHGLVILEDSILQDSFAPLRVDHIEKNYTPYAVPVYKKED